MSKARNSKTAAASGKTRTAATQIPWWLGGTDEECPHCGARYAFEVEIRCVDCDGPMCAFCAVRVRADTRCPDCPPPQGG